MSTSKHSINQSIKKTDFTVVLLWWGLLRLAPSSVTWLKVVLRWLCKSLLSYVCTCSILTVENVQDLFLQIQSHAYAAGSM